MFHEIPASVLRRMQCLQEMDAEDRRDGTPHLKRLRQVPPVTGRFLALLAASAPEGTCLELGTSAGYSTLWLALACRVRGSRIITFEMLEDKARLARETFKSAEVEDVVELIEGDARDHLKNYKNISFCFLDAEKKQYEECYEALVPNMVRGGLLVADNIISHKEILEPMVEKVLRDRRVDALVVPIGSGLLVTRRV